MQSTKTFTAQVVENGETVIAQDIPNHLKTMIGFLVHSDADDLLLKRGSMRLELDNVVLVEEGEPVRLFQKPVGDGFVATGEIVITTRRLNLRYRDTPATGTVFQPHKVRITLFFR